MLENKQTLVLNRINNVMFQTYYQYKSLVIKKYCISRYSQYYNRFGNPTLLAFLFYILIHSLIWYYFFACVLRFPFFSLMEWCFFPKDNLFLSIHIRNILSWNKSTTRKGQKTILIFVYAKYTTRWIINFVNLICPDF